MLKMIGVKTAIIFGLSISILLMRIIFCEIGIIQTIAIYIAIVLVGTFDIGKTKDFFHPSVAFPTIYFVLFGSGAAYLFMRNDMEAQNVLLYAFFGILSYQIGAHAIRDKKFSEEEPTIYLDWNRKKFFLIMPIVTLLSFLLAAYIYAKIGIPILSKDIFEMRTVTFQEATHFAFFLMRTIAIVFQFYFVYFFAFYKNQKKYPLWLIIFFLLAFFLLFSTACRSDLFLLLMPLVINYNYVIRRIRIKKAFLLGFLMIFLLIGLNFIRLFFSYSEHETLVYLKSISNDNYIIMFLNHFFAQLSLAGVSFKVILTCIPTVMDYFYGKVTIFALATLLPGHQITPGYIIKDVLNLNFIGGQHNLTLIGDFYADFGLPGIILGMFITGILIKLLYNNFVSRKTTTALMFYTFWYYALIIGILGGLLSQAGSRLYYFAVIFTLCFLIK